MKTVSKEDFDAHLATFPQLHRSVVFFCEPPVVTYSDPRKGNGFDAVIATESEIWDKDYQPTGAIEYRIKEDA